LNQLANFYENCFSVYETREQPKLVFPDPASCSCRWYSCFVSLIPGCNAWSGYRLPYFVDLLSDPTEVSMLFVGTVTRVSLHHEIYDKQRKPCM